MRRGVLAVFSILVFSSFVLFIGAFPKSAYADLVNPEYYIKKCGAGEIEVSCTYRSEEPDGPLTYNGCSPYKNNPNYRFLVGEGHSFGGGSKYCFKSASPFQLVKNVILRTLPQLLGTLIIELSVFYLLGFRSKRDLTTITLVNTVSVFAFAAVGITIQMNVLSILVAEVLITAFETLVISKGIHKPLKLVAKTTVVANILSAILGSFGLLLIRLM